jgi:hypothetical protein
MTDTTAAQRGWGPGWPHCQASKMTTIHPAGRAITCRREAATVLDYLVRRFDAEVEDINAVPDDGAFACRAIRGSDPPVPSNHSWGLAVDLNWQRHPLGRRGTFTSGQVLRIHLMTAEMRWVRWGGDYDHRADEMHFELLGTPTDIAGLTRRIAALSPWPAFDGHVLVKGSRGARVDLVQRRLGVPVTHVYDARTVSAVSAFQTGRHLDVDGKTGPDTWKRLQWKLR